MNRKEFVELSKASFHKWQADNATLRAAAIAFFTILPLPSLLIIIIGIFSIIYGQTQAIQQFITQLNLLAGPTIADIVNQLLGSQSDAFASTFGSVISVIFAVAGAIGAFAVLQDTLNTIWEAKLPKHRSFETKIREKIVPFLSVSGMGVIVVAWTGLTNVLFISLGFVPNSAVGSQASLVLGGFQIVLSFLLTALLFSIIYKQLPETKIEWKDVFLAAIVTSLVSTTVNYLFGIYIHTFPATSLAGTAGAIIVLMLWIFVTDEFILFGAQFSKIYAERHGSRFKKRNTASRL